MVEAVIDAAPASNDLAIAHAFSPTASASERINGLLGIGLSIEELSLSLGVAENTVRNWRSGLAEPRREADRALDDLRTLVLTLEDRGVRSSRAVNWMRSRNREWLNNERPLDLLRSDPLLLFAAAEDLDPPVAAVHARDTDIALTSSDPHQSEAVNSANKAPSD